MAKLIGMGGHIAIGSSNYPVIEWSVNVTNELQDVTDTGSAGWANRIAGISTASGSFKAFWGSSAATLSTVFTQGTSGTLTMKIGNGGQTVLAPCLIGDYAITNNCKTPVEFSCNWQSDGAITPAT